MRRVKKKMRRGAASFYVVAFSTLVLVIIAMSFAAIMISEMTRSSNDDLAQSAYDSALAGIEDAKLAFYNYMSCKEQGVTAAATRPTGNTAVSCADIIWYMEKSADDKNYNNCDMVAHILGRIKKDETSDNHKENGEATNGVLIQETTSSGTAMQQAYTCVKIKTLLTDYRSTLSESNTTRIVNVKLSGVDATDVKKMKVSWYSKNDGKDYVFTNTNGSNRVQFPVLREGKAATPPTISVGLVQTADSFGLADFDKVTATNTNRATLYLVPAGSEALAKSSSTPDNYIGVYNSTTRTNSITSAQVIKTNDRTVKNIPFAVYCPNNAGNDFACSTMIDLPAPINGTRNADTFIVVVSIPYGQPSTDFALEFYCDDSRACGSEMVNGAEVATSQISLHGVQVDIDSTGRANDLYRRIEARLDSADSFFPYPLFALELLGDKDRTLLEKKMEVTAEHSMGSYATNLQQVQSSY